ncbi:tRNA (cytosine34-C5)-methyltransferase [Fistulifera solaris]|uniref:tRNA (Cytosine34-C5)-methyltransferase n=1 Tax=Fistulifera solaris TaxID=1519565 RepID=A0A1Z5KJT4_FISSO|nr:tRNA (cytosine34-C5)-methyltransferase [Fistulifera solaris]|eukprot:GAX26342.1 tRNA (cytosine34-C5)-methyltransferase [Fistulifera solaris]
MPKRSNNPLAAARKSDSKADLLWHRKSGAAFQLFIEYYACQPLGVCSDGTVKEFPVAKHVTKMNCGQSRAAKRRKKKKQPNNDREGIDLVVDSVQINESSESPENERLHQAFAAYESADTIRDFIGSLSRALSLTFRIRQNLPSQEKETLQRLIVEQFSDLVAPCSFDPLIYQAKSSNVNKGSLLQSSPALKEFLVTNSQNGKIARQELASMLPVLVLHRGGWLTSETKRVLDLCASPGSKTMQVLEIMTRGSVKANDINKQRLESLQESMTRSGMSFSSKIKFSNLDASHFPIPLQEDKLYDCIICDVPCSGDGTIRKDPRVLTNWTPATSNALHRLQVDILARALKCLKVGGVMTYSTCSMNPIENEAVVAAALSQRKKGGGQPAFELVQWPVMEGFIGRPGVTKWKVADYVGDTDQEDDEKVQLRWHSSYEDAVEAKMEKACTSMWPPLSTNDLHLDRCVRLWPQDHDSGGFFVAVIKRIG